MERLAAAGILFVICVPAMAQTAPAFEVASIRPHDGPLSRIADFSSSGLRLTLGSYSVYELVLEAYGLQRYQLATGSGKLPQNDYYDITAIAPQGAAPTRDQFRRMIQALLADRFRLKFHREMREIPVYALVVDKGGAALKAGSGDGDCFLDDRASAAHRSQLSIPAQELPARTAGEQPQCRPADPG